ncbi:MAG: thiamine pyrophosphate-dependent enzyme [Candidatus Hodarchaeales archaeon]|jgi:2-oxoglutarate ferredoxin oxidoreductase subunit beta
MTLKPKKFTFDDHPVAPMIRTDRLPWIFCSGCSIGSEIQLVAKACQELINDNHIDTNDLVFVSGIGCTGRTSGYFNFDSFHTTHGRAIPLATGIKLANPRLKIIVFSGDGDLFAIGGNHIIHAARRNIDITVICINNSIYGMTGGQAAPTTPIGKYKTSTTPYGNFVEVPFNLVSLIAAAGATYVARYTALHTKEVLESIKTSITNPGFSFVEFVTPCPTYFAKSTGARTGLDMLKKLQNITEMRDGTPPHEAVFDYDDRIVCGEFVNRTRKEYAREYGEIRTLAIKK